MGPNSKDAVIRTLGHLVDELLQQREVGREILAAVRDLARRQDHQEQDHEALADKVAALPRWANGNGSE